MTKMSHRLRSVSRRTWLTGTAGKLGGAALALNPALAQSPTPRPTGGAANSPSNPRSFPRSSWLAQRREEIIEPGLEIVDPHHHLWDHDDYRFLLDELLADTGSGHNITKTVFIECGSMYRAVGPVEMKPVGETEFVNGTAAMSASGRYGPTRLCSGIVGHADLRLGERVARLLEAQIAAGDGRFRGIRHSVTWDASGVLPKARTNPSEGQMSDPTWRAGFARLAPLNLTFEAWLYHPQLADLAALARAFPQTTIILNHVGGPVGVGPYKDKKDDSFTQWKANIAEVAKSPNVVVKLGGLGMLFGMFDFYAKATPMRRRHRPPRPILRAPTSPTSKPVLQRLASSAQCFKATSRRTGSVRATPFYGTLSSVWLPVTPRPKRRCCSTALPPASTVWPEFFSRQPRALPSG
jgi:L-fuconolactonase